MFSINTGDDTEGALLGETRFCALGRCRVTRVFLAALFVGAALLLRSQAAAAASSPWDATGVWIPSNKNPDHCTASVVQSANQSVVLTAAHCVSPNDLTVTYTFCPGASGCASGVPRFTANYSDVHVDPHYNYNSPTQDEAYDFAFVTVHPATGTEPVGLVVAGGGLATNLSNAPPYGQSTGIYGYWNDWDGTSQGRTNISRLKYCGLYPTDRDPEHPSLIRMVYLM
jgi:Trypsin